METGGEGVYLPSGPVAGHLCATNNTSTTADPAIPQPGDGADLANELRLDVGGLVALPHLTVFVKTNGDVTGVRTRLLLGREGGLTDVIWWRERMELTMCLSVPLYGGASSPYHARPCTRAEIACHHVRFSNYYWAMNPSHVAARHRTGSGTVRCFL